MEKEYEETFLLFANPFILTCFIWILNISYQLWHWLINEGLIWAEGLKGTVLWGSHIDPAGLTFMFPHKRWLATKHGIRGKVTIQSYGIRHLGRQM